MSIKEKPNVDYVCAERIRGGVRFSGVRTTLIMGVFYAFLSFNKRIGFIWGGGFEPGNPPKICPCVCVCECIYRCVFKPILCLPFIKLKFKKIKMCISVHT